MTMLPRTEEAFVDFVSEQSSLYGSHDTYEVRTGVQGKVIGEKEFDPSRPWEINPVSLGEQMFDIPHTDVVIPTRPLHVRVVTHERTAPDTDRLGLIAAKHALANEIADTLEDALPGPTDRVLRYKVGSAVDVRDFDAETVATDGQPENDAKQIAEICQEGLTVVVSDFLKLPLEEQGRAKDFVSTIAVKANHAIDLELPAGIGSVQSGYRGGEINTNGPGFVARFLAKLRGQEPANELNEVNQLLMDAHQATVARLGAAGMSVASIILQPQLRRGFDVGVADTALAAAITEKTES